MSIENTLKHIEIIPAIKRCQATKDNASIIKQRVAAYARVSTDSEDQLNSYKTQCEYYDRVLGNDKSITFVGLYADEGITGTKMRKRKRFLDMIQDCRDGKIDKIVTKSVARFARNTAECLKIAQELCEKGITILFETQGIDTADPTSRLSLGIMATLAEEESRTISHNVAWGFQKRFERGIYVAGGRIYGYNIKNGKFEVDTTKLAIINNIFQWYLDGQTLWEIKQRLEEAKIPTPYGKEKWYINTIKSILSNEKYKGDLILQKTFKQDVLSERKKNNGERTKYMVTKNHVAIIKPELFDAVQIELQRRENIISEDNNLGKYTNNHAFSSIIECGECGTKFRRHSQWSLDKTKKVPIWVCIKHQKNKSECTQKPIKEENLEIGFINALNQLTAKKNEIIFKVKNNINETIQRPDIKSILEMKKALKEKQSELLRLNKKAIMQSSTKELENEIRDLINDIQDIQNQLEIIKDKQDNLSIIDYRLKEIDKMLKKSYTEFNKEVLRTLIDKIIIKDKHKATYLFKCGIAIDQEI